MDPLRRDPTRTVTILVLGYFASAVLLWTATTPPGGVADEPAHLAYSAGVIRGNLANIARLDDGSKLPIVVVPEWLGGVVACWAFDPEVTADCAPGINDSQDLGRLSTKARRYPPPYYWIVGLPTLVLTGEDALYAMRSVAGVLAIGLIALGLAVADRATRLWLAMGAAIAFTPVAANFAGSVNPTGTEAAAALGLSIGITGLAESEHRSWKVKAAMLLVLVFALAWARPWGVIILAAVLVVSPMANSNARAWIRKRAVATVVGTGTAVAALGAVAYEIFIRRPFENELKAGAETLASGGPGIVDNLNSVADNVVTWTFDLIGRFGWLDHTAPSFVSGSWLLLASTVCVLALVVGSRWDRAVISLGAAGTFVLAPLFATEFILGSVAGYQARYHLPLAMLLVIVAVRILSRLPEGTKRRIAWPVIRWGAVLAPVGMLISIASSLQRHGVGAPLQLSDLLTLSFLTDAKWLPPPKALAVGAFALLGVIACAVGLWRVARKLPTSEHGVAVQEGSPS